MNTLNFKIEKDYIPVVINGLEFQFETNEENLAKFIGMKEHIESEMDELKKGMPDIDDEDDISKEDVEQVLNIAKESLKIQYDVMLGTGSFERLYEIVPSIEKLSDLLAEIGESLSAELKTLEKNKKANKEKIKSQYLIKKKKNKK